ncbi:hypothetical protein [Methylosinus sp. LW4]|uniref:hypothetical protein n=1 Tax=Methylosinus sp. LW4 TaxID=136993 RepID=UPI00035D70C3|nr:hypothetical protein [Methylosinus sp. LW4]
MRRAYIDIVVELLRKEAVDLLANAGLAIIGSAYFDHRGVIRLMIEGDALGAEFEVDEGTIPKVANLFLVEHMREGVRSAEIDRFQVTSLQPIPICTCNKSGWGVIV